MCTPAKNSTGVAVAVLLLVKGLWLLTAKVLAPAVLALAVVAWRWLSGAPMRPTWTGRRLVTRPVRATAQTLLTAAAVCGWLFPLITAVVVTVLGVGFGAAVVLARHRQRPADREPINVGVVTVARRVALPASPGQRSWDGADARVAGMRR